MLDSYHVYTKLSLITPPSQRLVMIRVQKSDSSGAQMKLFEMTEHRRGKAMDSRSGVKIFLAREKERERM